MFFEPKTLIVIYKDELMLNQLKKLIETKDDTEGSVVGITDGSVRVVAWSEKIWKDQKKAGNISNKVLFLGDIKGTDKLIPILDVKYNQFGITYGWAGNQAILFVNPKALSQKTDYNEFLKALMVYQVPDKLKSEIAPEKEPVNNQAIFEEPTLSGVEEVADSSQEKKKGFFSKLGDTLSTVGKTVAKVAQDAGASISKVASNVKEDVTTDWEKIEKQQLFYGIIKLYENDLEKYMQS